MSRPGLGCLLYLAKDGAGEIKRCIRDARDTWSQMGTVSGKASACSVQWNLRIYVAFASEGGLQFQHIRLRRSAMFGLPSLPQARGCGIGVDVGRHRCLLVTVAKRGVEGDLLVWR